MKGLREKERAAWLAFASGVDGLSGCRPFLEDKLANDIFLEGEFQGAPCVVKCSSRAPESLDDEFRFATRLHAADARVFPRPFAHSVSPDGRRACFVVEKLPGPSLFALFEAGKISAADANRFAADLLAAAAALRAEGIVHRDVHPDNFLLGADGHLKLIDVQFAVDRNAYRESAWMAARPVYLYSTFGVNSDLGVGRWNDADAILACLARLPQTESVCAAAAKLQAERDGFTFAPPLPRGVLRRLRWHRLSLRVQLALRRSPRHRQAISSRLAKLERLFSGGKR